MKPRSRLESQEPSQASRCTARSVWEGGREGWACSSLTYLHASDFHCLPTLLTITKRLCTLAAAQHSYTYCGPLSKETCTTSPGVLPKGHSFCFKTYQAPQHSEHSPLLSLYLFPFSLSPLIPLREHARWLNCLWQVPLTLLFIISFMFAVIFHGVVTVQIRWKYFTSLDNYHIFLKILSNVQ